MKLNTQDLSRRWQTPALVIAALGPIGPSLFCYLLPQAWALSWVFPGLCLVLACFGMLLEKKSRRIYSFIGSCLLMATGLLLLIPGTDRSFGYMLLAIPAMYGFVLIVILSMADENRSKEPLAPSIVAGLFLYLFWQIFYRIRITSNDPAMEPAEDSILSCFLVFLMLTLLSRNRSSLSFASMGRFSLPPVMHRVNRLLIILFLIAVLLLGAVPFIGRVLAAPLLGAFQGLGSLLNLFLSLKPTQQAPSAPNVPKESVAWGDIAENVYGSEGVNIPETTTQILFALFILAVSYFIIRALILLVRFLFRLLHSMVRSTDEENSNAYEDEISDVRDTVTTLTPKQKKRTRSALRQRQLSPTQQIRYRYRVLKKRHSKWRDSDTVRKQLPPEAAQLYERARYGQKEATEQDVKTFETKTRGL